jgi:hypothetical protein
MVSSPIELNKCCKELCSKLYASEIDKEGSGKTRKAFPRVLKDKILEQMKRKLAQPIIEEELHSSLEAMAKGKTMKPDGVVT